MKEHNHSQYALNPLPNELSDNSTQSDGWNLEPVLTPPPTPMQGGVFCRFCGSNVLAEAVMCVSCGRQIKVLQTTVQPQAAPAQVSEGKPWSSGEAIILLLLTLGLPIIGFIFGIRGLCERGKQQQGAGLLVAAIMVSYYWFSKTYMPH